MPANSKRRMRASVLLKCMGVGAIIRVCGALSNANGYRLRQRRRQVRARPSEWGVVSPRTQAPPKMGVVKYSKGCIVSSLKK